MKLHNLIICGALLAGAMSSCSDVKEDDRLIDTGVFNPARAILLEDFTGQRCVNCPDAHVLIEDLEKQYGDSLIAVSVHAGGLAIKESRGGLANDQGEEYNAFYKIDAWPRGVINLSGNVLKMATWPADTRIAMSSPSQAYVYPKAKVTDDNKNIEVELTIAPKGSMKAKVMVWVLESGIVATQRKQEANGNVIDIPDYVHNHVFRLSAPSTWGEDIELTADQPLDKNYTIEVGEDWNVANLAVVSIVYDDNGVISVARREVEAPGAETDADDNTAE